MMLQFGPFVALTLGIVAMDIGLGMRQDCGRWNWVSCTLMNPLAMPDAGCRVETACSRFMPTAVTMVGLLHIEVAIEGVNSRSNN